MRHAIRWQSSQALACQPKAFPLSMRLWPASQGHFLHGKFRIILRIYLNRWKTNKTHGFEHFTCNPLRDPHFQKTCTRINQWDHGPESIFPSMGRENLPPCFHPGLLSKICYNILQLQQVLVHEDTEAKKLMGGNGVCTALR